MQFVFSTGDYDNDENGPTHRNWWPGTVVDLRDRPAGCLCCKLSSAIIPVQQKDGGAVLSTVAPYSIKDLRTIGSFGFSCYRSFCLLIMVIVVSTLDVTVGPLVVLDVRSSCYCSYRCD